MKRARDPKDSIRKIQLSRLAGKKSIRQLRVLVTVRLFVRAIKKSIKQISGRRSLNRSFRDLSLGKLHFAINES